MANIIGSAFDSWVTSQIKLRQKVLGKIAPTHDDIKAFTTKTPWIRLASAVDLKNVKGQKDTYDKLKKIIPKSILDEKCVGNGKLARNFVLMGTPLQYSQEPYQNDKGETKNKNVYKQGFSGLNYTNEVFNGAYGWGGIDERGYVPLPGITNASIDYFSDGALTKTTLNIRCYNRVQFAIIDVLFMRPGYTALLEWGHSGYLDNKSEKFVPWERMVTKPFNYLFNPKSSDDHGYGQTQMANKIFQERKRNYGNYDAVYSKISKFSWTFNADGSYDIIVEMVGMGSVIQGLRLNTTRVDSDKVDNADGTSTTKDGDVLVASKNISFLNSYLYDLSKSLKKNALKYSTNGKWDSNDGGGAYSKYFDMYVKDCFFDGNPKGKKMKFPAGCGVVYAANATSTGPQTAAETDLDNFEYYIKFGLLLCLLEGRCGSYTTVGNSKYPLIMFDVNYRGLHDKDIIDYDFEKEGKDGTGETKPKGIDRNYMLILPTNIPADPTVCLAWPGVEYKKWIGEPNNIQPHIYDRFLNYTNFQVSGNKFIGRMMNMMINTRFITDTINNMNKDSDGGLPIFDFLQQILDSCAESLGSINNFRIMFNEDTGKIKIYDEIPPNYSFTNIKGVYNEDYARINTFGVKPNEYDGETFTGGGGSFCRNLSLNAELSDEFATMIAIGAQAGGTQLNGNATSFSMYNKGLTDRILPTKLDYHTAAKDKEDGKKTKKELLKENFENNIYNSDNKTIFQKMYWSSGDGYTFSNENVKAMKQYMATHTQLLAGILTEYEGTLNAPFFIPFNVQIDLDGISGIKMYEKFKMNDDVLPPSYTRGGVDLIVKAINHSINSSEGWVTKLETMSVPSQNVEEADDKEDNSNKERDIEKEKYTDFVETTVTGGPENAKLRMKVYRFLDDGWQTLGYMEILDEDEITVLARFTTTELPWRQNVNNWSCIPAGRFWVRERYMGSKHGKHWQFQGRESDREGWGKYDDDGWKEFGKKHRPRAGSINWKALKNHEYFVGSGNDKPKGAENAIKGIVKVKAGQNYDRGHCLIHRCPYAIDVLRGCMGVGLAFNTHQLGQRSLGKAKTKPTAGKGGSIIKNPSGLATPTGYLNRGPDNSRLKTAQKEKGFTKSAMKESNEAMSLMRSLLKWDEGYQSSDGFMCQINYVVPDGQGGFQVIEELEPSMTEGTYGQMAAEWNNSPGDSYQQEFFTGQSSMLKAKKALEEGGYQIVDSGVIGDSWGNPTGI